MNEVALTFPKTLRFVVCDSSEADITNNCIQSPPVVLARSCDAEEFATTLERAFRIDSWAGSESLQKLVARMERLPSVPVLYNQVVNELAKPEGSIQFIGLLISKDPAMTAKILQMINSAVFGLPRQITDPVEAVLYLGVERTKSLILLASVFLHFDKDACPGFSHERLWQHSLAVGAFGRTIALPQTKDPKLAEMAYTAGLLHDVGKLFLAANLPETYSQVLDQAQRRKISEREVELEVFDASHAELGAAVLGAWGLPLPILEAIAWHHSPSASEDDTFSALTAVHAANAVEREKVLHKNGRAVSQMDSAYLTRIHLIKQRNVWRGACGFHVPVVDDLKRERFMLREEGKEWEG